MIRIVKWMLIAGVLAALSSPSARANTLNPPSCSQSDVQAAINSAANGDTVAVPAGSCTWSSQVAISGKGLTLIGATTCTGSGDPRQNNLACTDNTSITLTYASDAALLISGSSAANFDRVTGFTFVDGTGGTSNGVIQFRGGRHGDVAFRFDHTHLESNSGGAFVKFSDSYGVVDHNLLTETGTRGMNPPFTPYGDGATRGYQNWNDPTNEGSNQAIYLEQNTYNAMHSGTEGFFDAYSGAKVVVRFNTIGNSGNPGGHGTDSGNYRSTVLVEIYDNSMTNTSGGSLDPFTVRGGITLFFNNSLTGTSPWTGISLGYFRISQVTDIGRWGSALAGLNWIPLSGDPTNENSTNNTLNAPDWRPSSSYTAGAVVGPLAGSNSGNWNFQNRGSSCTSGGSGPSWNQVPGGMTSDGSCTWTNVGGTTTPGLMPARWCAANPDTLAVSDATCSSLIPGDTATRYFDSPNGTYPFRDQPGVGHNQVSFPNYEWGNTGSQAPSEPLFATNAPGVVQADRDWYDYTSSFTGATGVGSGVFAARPSSCTTGVGYWATDQGDWNTSGNGAGQGVLYQCSGTNTWSAYYTPYLYPYPATQTTNSPAPPTNVEATVIQ
jgi:hypothetical protein